MLPQHFLGRKPSHFNVHPIVKAYIISESFLWGAWNLFTPIFAIFLVEKIKGGNIELAASGFSVYLVSRVVFELISGRLLVGSGDARKLFMAIIGMLCVSAGYLGFAYANTIGEVFFYYVVLGLGLGLSMPAQCALFSIHLDPKKEVTEWSFADALQFLCMALTTALGGFIASQYGFSFLFLLAGAINTIGILPYLLLLTYPKNK